MVALSILTPRKTVPDVYEKFVIDAVPERTDLGALQLVTSTSNLDEVRNLVDNALEEMGLSSSERNSRFLLAQLKSLSGRLAIRLANPGGSTGEMIALALVQAQCVQRDEHSEAWLDLTQGFFVPVDEIADLEPISGFVGTGNEMEGHHRADFIHVSAPARGPLEFRFVEVKHRRHLRTARQPELMDGILKQTGDLRRRWNGYYFGISLKPLERAVRRSLLVRILRFYAERAGRHHLLPPALLRLTREIDQLVLKEKYEPVDLPNPDIGYIFCPEHRTGAPELLYTRDAEEARIWLFGPSLLPDERVVYTTEQLSGDSHPEPAESSSVTNVQFESLDKEDGASEERTSAHGNESLLEIAHPTGDVVLGKTIGGDEDVLWNVSIRSNPHLMLVGLPGMGKTTSLVNICSQLADEGITPIVFSYHDDIDTQLQQRLGGINFADYDGLGFNPLRVDGTQSTAHIDVAGTLRDIFSSIFPDLGDLQLEELRKAIKQSYDDAGWHARTSPLEQPSVPRFRAFFEILSSATKPNAGLLARLQELSDYNFFDNAGDRPAVLSDNSPTIIRMHGTSNSMLQNAFASFMFYSLYKEMFRRGVQSKMTHAIVFDEAHRAAKLTLIPQFAKECRKFGIALILASQESKDFSESLYSAVSNYLVLRVAEPDARSLARKVGATADEKRISDRMKALDKYTAVFFAEGRARPTSLRLRS